MPFALKLDCNFELELGISPQFNNLYIACKVVEWSQWWCLLVRPILAAGMGTVHFIKSVNVCNIFLVQMRGPSYGGSPVHGTFGTMVNPALGIRS